MGDNDEVAIRPAPRGVPIPRRWEFGRAPKIGPFSTTRHQKSEYVDNLDVPKNWEFLRSRIAVLGRILNCLEASPSCCPDDSVLQNGRLPACYGVFGEKCNRGAITVSRPSKLKKKHPIRMLWRFWKKYKSGNSCGTAKENGPLSSVRDEFPRKTRTPRPTLEACRVSDYHPATFLHV